MAHIIFLTGYPGAGKTTAVKSLLSKSKHVRTWLRADTPFANHPFRGTPKKHEMGSLWDFNGEQFIAAGCHRLDVTNKQGAEIFVSMPKYDVIEWLCQQANTVIWDHFNVGPQMLKRLSHHKLTYIHLNTPMDVAMQQRDARRDSRHHSAKCAIDLQKMYNQTDNNYSRVNGLATRISTEMPVHTIIKMLKPEH